MKKTIIIISILSVFLVGWIVGGGASNFDRLVLGEGNFGTDPNTTADITGQNDEYMSNYVNGTWDFGSANITTSGTITTAGYVTTDARDTVVGVIDSVKNSAFTATDKVILSRYFTSGTTLDTIDAVNVAMSTGRMLLTRKDATNGNVVYDYIIIH